MGRPIPRGPIESLRLQNLRRFEDTGRIELATFNFVFGKNSSGKTTFLRGPLLFRQLVEASQYSAIDNALAGPFVDFGSYAEAVYASQVSRDIILTLEIDLTAEHRRFAPRRDRTTDPLGNPIITTVLHWNKTRGHLQFSSIDAKERSGAPIIHLKRLGPQRVHAEIPVLGLDRAFNDIGELSFGSLRLIVMDALTTDRMGLNAFEVFSLFDSLTRTLNKVHHVGPLRDMPERAYRTDLISLPGGSTRNALGLLFHNMSATNAVNRALRTLGMARSIELTTPAPGYAGISIAEVGSSRRDNLADVGFGVSQVLPILVRIATAEEGSLVLVEQPELHLHPETQGTLVDVMIDLAKQRGVSLLVETHSENMLLRLRRRVAAKEIHSDNIQILVTTEGQVRRAVVDELGLIDMSVFPNDFFEEDWLDTIEIARASQTTSS